MVIKYDFWCNPVNDNRRLHIYLPDDYYESEEHYPVVYMFDGHNLFFDADTSFGNSWRIKDFLDGWSKKLIVVGIECARDERRITEYCPYDTYMYSFGNIKGTGDAIMQWMVGPLKEHIDKHYRTYPFRECTAIGGSSMGGLMSLYAVLHYNQYFSKAAAVSPAVNTAYSQLKKELAKAKLNADTRVFFSWGTKEWKGISKTEKYLFDIEGKLMDQGCKTYMYRHEGGIHNEVCWREEVPVWMNFLWF